MSRATVLAVAVCALAACVSADAPDNAAALGDIRGGRTGREVVISGLVTHVYPPASGSFGEHEHFDVSVNEGAATQSISIEDNISIGAAPPVHPGDAVVIKGVLELDMTGPVIHWTHHDPSFRHVPGFVKVGGRTYD